MSGKNITAVRILTLLNVRVPVQVAGIGSTRAGRFRRNIMYIETRHRTVAQSFLMIDANTHVRTVG
jgi:hypothetical protein